MGEKGGVGCGVGEPSFDAEADQWPLDCWEHYVDCDFVPVCSKVMQVLKGPCEVTAFSLFLSLFDGGSTWPGPQDTSITGP